MKLPAPWLLFSILVHGLLGSFGELLDIMINRLSTPITHFYNESIHLHYGVTVDSDQAMLITSFIENFAIGGSILAVIFLIPKMDTYGRKNIAVYIRSGIGMAAAVLIILAKSFVTFELFAVAQVFCGFVRPLKLGIAKAYISECSPAETRGFVTQGIATCSYVVIIASAVLTLPFAFGNDQRWHWMAAISLIFATMFVIMGSYIPESPKYSLMRGENKKAVMQTIKKFHGKSVDMGNIFC